MGLDKWSCTSCVLLGLAARLALFQMKPLVSYLMTRVEIQTPASSWESMQEGMFLDQNGISPYEGSLFHNQPLLLKFFIQLQNISAKFEVDFAFFFLLFCDILAGYSLFKCCETYLEQRQEEEKLLSQTEFDKDAYEVFNAGKRSVEHYAKIVTLAYLLNPFTIISCACKTMLPLELLLYARLLLFCLRRNFAGAIMALSLVTYLFMWPILLWVPVCYMFVEPAKSENEEEHCENCFCVYFSMFVSVASLVLLTALLMLISFYVCDYSFDFFFASWGFHFAIPDLQPNVGLHWYFYMEMFDQYRTFFTLMINTITVSICIPLCWKFSENRIIPVYSAMYFIAMYKSFPSFGDVSLCLSLVPMFAQNFSMMRNLLFTFLLFMSCFASMPAMYHVWVVTFNPNFFYAITLIYGTVHMLIWSDVIFSLNRRQFLFRNGLKYPVDENGVLKRFTLL